MLLVALVVVVVVVAFLALVLPLLSVDTGGNR